MMFQKTLATDMEISPDLFLKRPGLVPSAQIQLPNKLLFCFLLPHFFVALLQMGLYYANCRRGRFVRGVTAVYSLYMYVVLRLFPSFPLVLCLFFNH
mgnify:CR=1 FL=1